MGKGAPRSSFVLLLVLHSIREVEAHGSCGWAHCMADRENDLVVSMQHT